MNILSKLKKKICGEIGSVGENKCKKIRLLRFWGISPKKKSFRKIKKKSRDIVHQLLHAKFQKNRPSGSRDISVTD